MDTSNVMAGMNPGYLPPAYMFMNIFILSFGVWAIALPESRDSVVMFLGLLLFSIIQDIVFISVYQPRAYALIFQDRGGSYDDLNIPGFPQFDLTFGEIWITIWTTSK
ncbi:hypothetical protein KUTeg_001926, partial [Tegillarca granosa]